MSQSNVVSASDLMRAQIKKEVLQGQIQTYQAAIEEIEHEITDLDSILQGKPPAEASALEQAISRIQWRKKDEGFSWAFNTGKDGKQLEETRELAGAIHGSNGKLVVGKFEYSISGDEKFLQRRKKD